MPKRVPVPSWLSENCTPLGGALIIAIAGVGDPVAVTVNDPADPTVKVVEFALVIVGAVPAFAVTVRIPTLLVALPSLFVNTALYHVPVMNACASGVL